jgi:hypothetical protein
MKNVDKIRTRDFRNTKQELKVAVILHTLEVQVRISALKLPIMTEEVFVVLLILPRQILG